MLVATMRSTGTPIKGRALSVPLVARAMTAVRMPSTTRYSEKLKSQFAAHLAFSHTSGNGDRRVSTSTVTTSSSTCCSTSSHLSRQPVRSPPMGAMQAGPGHELASSYEKARS